MFTITALASRENTDQLLSVGDINCEFEKSGRTNVAGVMMPLDQHSVNTCVLWTTAAFEDFVEVGKIAMVVAVGPATLASQLAAGTSLLPLVVKHRIANLL
jgi:hypothetical protein